MNIGKYISPYMSSSDFIFAGDAIMWRMIFINSSTPLLAFINNSTFNTIRDRTIQPMLIAVISAVEHET